MADFYSEHFNRGFGNSEESLRRERARINAEAADEPSAYLSTWEVAQLKGCDEEDVIDAVKRKMLPISHPAELQFRMCIARADASAWTPTD